MARADEEEAGRLLEAELEPQLEWCRLLYADALLRWGLDLQRAEMRKYCAPPAAVTGAPGAVEVHLVAPTIYLARADGSGRPFSLGHVSPTSGRSGRSESSSSVSSAGGGRNSLGNPNPNFNPNPNPNPNSNPNPNPNANPNPNFNPNPNPNPNQVWAARSARHSPRPSA